MASYSKSRNTNGPAALRSKAHAKAQMARQAAEKKSSAADKAKRVAKKEAAASDTEDEE